MVSEPRHQRANILGVAVSAINMDHAVLTIDNWILQGKSNYVCVTPVHSIMECHHIPELKPIFNNSGLTTPDGMWVMWILKLLGHTDVDRVYGPDLMLALSDHSQETGYRHFFYGGAPGVADKLVSKLQAQFPKLQIAGTYCPPFRELTYQEKDEIVATITESRSDIVWVCLGSPKQEQWIAEHVNKIPGATLVGVGAAFDYLSGHKRQAPRWIQRSGFEWFYRFLAEPKRQARRYLINNPIFVWNFALQYLNLRRFTLTTESSLNSETSQVTS